MASLTQGFSGSLDEALQSLTVVDLTVTGTQTVQNNQTLQGDTTIGDASNDDLTINATLASAFALGGFNLTNGGRIEADQFDVINAGAGSNPTLTSNDTNQTLTLTGRFGIGESAAEAPLHVTNDQAALTEVRLDNSNAAGSMAYTFYDGSNERAGVNYDTAAALLDIRTTVSTGQIAFSTNTDVEALRIDDSQNVDIVDGTLDIVTGPLQLAGTTLFENDRDFAVDLLPNADATLDVGSSTRTLADFHSQTGTFYQGLIVNEDGGSNDLRVESSGQDPMLEVTGAQDQVNIHTTFNADWGALNVGARNASAAAEVDMVATLADSTDSASIQNTNASVWGVRIGNPTINSAGGATTVTDSAALYVPGPIQAGTDVTITNQYVALLEDGSSNKLFRFAAAGDFDIVSGTLDVGGTTLFENDRDVAVDLLPNATAGASGLDLGSATRYWDTLFGRTLQVENQGAGSDPTLTSNDAAQVLTLTGSLDLSTFDLITDTTTGTTIGTGATQKLGFFGATPVVQPSAYTPTNVTTDRSYDANSTTTDELADVLGTLISDLQSLGLIA